LTQLSAEAGDKRRAEKISMTIQSTGLGALSSASRDLDRAAADVRKASQPPPEDPQAATSQDRVDLSEAAVGLLRAKRSHEIGVKLIQTADEIAENAIDLLG
jgi:flagellar basal body rod protein FlgC